MTCTDTWRGDRCTRPADHDGLHSNDTRAWDFRDNTVPEWRRRAAAHSLPAKDFTAASR
jgi:hypothetical protein